ncbi:MAG: TRAP transporter substrate-binding protein, partial [Alphaproteobacteria bacterium]|nr:TRAP transporter substrate-binding protein [Alphaproteobacteria bacterium]
MFGTCGIGSRLAAALIAPLLLLASALAGPVLAADAKWDMPTPYVDGNFRTQTVRWFVDEVRKATNGRLEITVYDNASLFPMPEIKGAVQSGQVNIGEFLLSAYGHEDPIFECDGIPFLASGLDAAWRLYQAQKPFLERRLQAQKLHLLYSVPGPGQGFYTRTPISHLSDFRGIKFRAISPVSQRLASLLGAQPVSIPAVSVRQAFASGEVNAMLGSWTFGTDTSAWDYARYYYPTDAMHLRDAVIVNERAFRRLASDIQSALVEVGARAEQRGWDQARQNGVETKRVFVEHGLKVIEPSAEMMAEFRTIGRIMMDEWVKRAGPDGEAIARAL